MKLSWLLLWITLQLSSAFKLRVMKVEISDENGSGMNGGNLLSVGGQLRLKICDQDKCCQTKDRLNTEDNNWERGDINFFVGRQLKECQNFELPDTNDTVVNVTWKHSGTDGVGLKQMWMRGSQRHGSPIWRCPINFKLDENDEKTFGCFLKTPGDSKNRRCNGRSEFCKLPFNRLLFAGTHNAGTGQGPEGFLPMLYKNQDLNVTEQLDFGIRIFDFDIFYSTTKPGCKGLMTGHGETSALYQCYDSVENILRGIDSWMKDNPTDVIVLYFGALKPDASTTVRELDMILGSALGDQINKQWTENGTWPSIGDAIQENKRIFIFVRDPNPNPESVNYIREIQVKDDDEVELEGKGATILSTFKSMHIGNHCSKVVRDVEGICQRHSHVDLVKVSVFGTFVWNWTPLEVMARKCNPRGKEVLENCQSGLIGTTTTVNFIMEDFPNYPGGKESLPEITDEENLRRSSIYN